MAHNHLTGGLEPLKGCTLLLGLYLSRNRITGSLEPLQSCTALLTCDTSGCVFSHVSGVVMLTPDTSRYVELASDRPMCLPDEQFFHSRSRTAAALLLLLLLLLYCSCSV